MLHIAWRSLAGYAENSSRCRRKPSHLDTSQRLQRFFLCC